MCNTIGSLCLIALVTVCNRIPNNVTPNDAVLNQNLVQKSFKVDSLFIFNTKKGYTVDFSGIRICTTIINNVPTTTMDSLYSRITCLGDTLITLNDSLYGVAEFRKADAESWDSLFAKARDTNNLIGKMIAENMDPNDLAIIKSCQSFTQLADSNKTSVINTLNNIISTDETYSRYVNAMKNEIFFNKIIAALDEDVAYMIGRSIFLDTIGTVREGISPYEKEILKWFNWRTIVEYLDNESNAVDRGKLFKRYPSAGRLYYMSFQQGLTNDFTAANEIIRFIMISSTSMSQIAYQDKSGLQIISDIKISDYPFMCDTGWTATPLLLSTHIPFLSSNDFASSFRTGKTAMRFNDYVDPYIDVTFNDSVWYYSLDTYYPLANKTMVNGNPARLAGVVTSSLGYFKSSNLEMNKFQGYFTNWNMEIVLEIKLIDEKIYKYREICLLNSKDGT